jgi:hypothetical protein
LNSFASELQSEVTHLNVQLALEQKTSQEWQSKYETANKDIQIVQTDVDYYKPFKSLYENALKKTIDKYTGRQLINMGIKKLFIKK